MEDDKSDGKDMVLIGDAEGPDGWTPCVRHKPDHTVTVGAIKPVKDGESIGAGELISIKEGEGPLREVETLWSSDRGPEGDAGPNNGKGPAMVNSKAYGDGWERIFGGRSKVGDA